MVSSIFGITPLNAICVAMKYLRLESRVILMSCILIFSYEILNSNLQALPARYVGRLIMTGHLRMDRQGLCHSLMLTRSLYGYLMENVIYTVRTRKSSSIRFKMDLLTLYMVRQLY